MPRDSEGSVTRWVSDVKAGDRDATQALWERYFDRLVRLARTKLSSRRRSGAEADEEDAALSAFDSFCAGAERGRFPQLLDRDDLWRLLVKITVRKAYDQLSRERALKRRPEGGVILGESVLAGGDEHSHSLDQLIGGEPTPEFAATVAEQCQFLLDSLGDPGLRHIAIWKMEGFTNQEIAHRLGCAVRTVANKLVLIRGIWEREQPT